MNKTKANFIHIFMNFPRLGLLKEGTNKIDAISEIKYKIWTQLRDMSLEKFEGYCEIRYLEKNPIEDYGLFIDGKATFKLPKGEFIG